MVPPNVGSGVHHGVTRGPGFLDMAHAITQNCQSDTTPRANVPFVGLNVGLSANRAVDNP
jgi:hypothetical protein